MHRQPLHAASEPSAAPPAVSPSSTPSGVTQASPRLDYYVPLIRGLAREATFGDPLDLLVVRTEICATAGSFTDAPEVCEDAFSPAERSALRKRLSWFTEHLWFVEDARAGAVRPGRGVVVWMGPHDRTADRVRIGAGMWCGGLCGEGGTYVVERRDDRWVFKGHAPGTSGWIQ